MDDAQPGPDLAGAVKVAVHYGDHPGGTGVAFGAAVERLAMGWARPHRSREHPMLGADAQAGGAFWVESFVSSLPVDAHDVPFPTAGYVIDTHLHLHRSALQAQLFDVVFVAQRDDVATVAAESGHPNVRWLPLAAPPAFLALERRPTYPVAFVGNILHPPQREGLLAAVNKEAAMNDWRRFHLVEEMGDVYRRSRIVLNPPARADLNMRFFEAMACGAVVVTPPIDNGLSAIATDGDHYLSTDFGDGPTLALAVRAMLDTDLEAIGARARRLVAGGHTYDHRMAEVARTLASTPLAAPVRTMSERERGRLLVAIAADVGDLPLLVEGVRTSPAAGDAGLAGRALTRGTKSLARDLSPPWFRDAYRAARRAARRSG